MTLKAFQRSDGRWALQGVTNDPSAPGLLGRKYFHVGPHWFGVDDSFTDAVSVRAYFDPVEYRAMFQVDPARFDFIGYTQCAQLSFCGMPVPPQVYGGRLADREPYVFSPVQHFLDFMGPSDSLAARVGLPLYPFNSRLFGLKNEDLFSDLVPNGALWSPAPHGDRQSLVASLAANVAPGLVTRDRLGEAVAGLPELARITPKGELTLEYPAYQIALEALSNVPLKGSTVPWLNGLKPAQVEAELIGELVVLTLPDPEELGDALVVHTDRGPAGEPVVVVRVLPAYDLTVLKTDTGNDLLWRIQGHADRTGMRLPYPPARRGWGTSGLHSPPFRPPAEHYPLQLRYWTATIGVSGGGSRVLSCFTWALLFQYEEIGGRFIASALDEPQMVDGFDWHAAVTGLHKAQHTSPGAVIDPTNFTAAALWRQPYTGGPKLQFPSDRQ